MILQGEIGLSSKPRIYFDFRGNKLILRGELISETQPLASEVEAVEYVLRRALEEIVGLFPEIDK